jgi:hypothetical protein
MNIVNSQIVAFPQIEQQNFENRVKEIVSKKKQKLWEIQARVDSAKREVHCAKVWAKILGDGNRQQLDSLDSIHTTHFCGLNCMLSMSFQNPNMNYYELMHLAKG